MELCRQTDIRLLNADFVTGALISLPPLLMSRFRSFSGSLMFQI